MLGSPQIRRSLFLQVFPPAIPCTLQLLLLPTDHLPTTSPVHGGAPSYDRLFFTCLFFYQAGVCPVGFPMLHIPAAVVLVLHSLHSLVILLL